jgi:KaiC/GvpD/RAD55 family RecA-like ATPase
MTEEIIRTYIKGFDEQLGGGIPKEHVVLVAGSAGTMKSTVAYNMLYNNASKDGMKCLYVSLEQSRKSILKQMNHLGMSKLPDDQLGIVDLGVIRKKLNSIGKNGWMDVFKLNVENLKRNFGYNILVVDSLTALEVIAKMEKPREELFKLFEWLRDMGMTTFLILETEECEKIGLNGESYLADGIIKLDMEEINATDVQRRIRCVKMRSINHHTGYFSLMFRDNKFQVTKSITP